MTGDNALDFGLKFEIPRRHERARPQGWRRHLGGSAVRIVVTSGRISLRSESLLEEIHSRRELYSHDWSNGTSVMLPWAYRTILGRRWLFIGRECLYNELLLARLERGLAAELPK
jgi:hypothetical protein